MTISDNINRRDPYAFECVRLVVALRLLSFPVESIATITGIARVRVRTMLKEHGRMPRDRLGRFKWRQWYDVPSYRYRFLQLPAFIPRRAESADKRIAHAIVAALGSDVWEFSLPPATNAPSRGYRADWGAEAHRSR